MKTRLDNLTLTELIELACGDISVLTDKGENVTPEQLTKASKEILTEFKVIAMPNRAKIDLLDSEELQKLLMKERCMRVCMLLCSQDRFDYAKEILIELDVPQAQLDTDEKVKNKCKAMHNDALFEVEHFEKRNNSEQKNSSKDEIRRSWHKEVAWVMSVFKMSIDMNTMNASVYANLVNQAVEHSKQLAKMPPMSRLFY